MSQKIIRVTNWLKNQGNDGYAELIEEFYPVLSEALDKTFIEDIPKNQEGSRRKLAEIYFAFILNHHLKFSVDSFKPKKNPDGPDFYLKDHNLHIEVTVADSGDWSDHRFCTRDTYQINGTKHIITGFDANQKQQLLSSLTGALKNKIQSDQIKKVDASEKMLLALSYSLASPYPGDLMDHEYFPSYIRAFLPINKFSTFDVTSRQEVCIAQPILIKFNKKDEKSDIDIMKLWEEAHNKKVIGVLLFSHDFNNDLFWLKKNAWFDIVLNPYESLDGNEIKKILNIGSGTVRCRIYKFHPSTGDIKIYCCLPQEEFSHHS